MVAQDEGNVKLAHHQGQGKRCGENHSVFQGQPGIGKTGWNVL